MWEICWKFWVAFRNVRTWNHLVIDSRCFCSRNSYPATVRGNRYASFTCAEPIRLSWAVAAAHVFMSYSWSVHWGKGQTCLSCCIFPSSCLHCENRVSSVTPIYQQQQLKFTIPITEIFQRAFCTLVSLLKYGLDICRPCRFMLQMAFKQKTIHS